jgi:hypothetical protein
MFKCIDTFSRSKLSLLSSVSMGDGPFQMSRIVVYCVVSRLGESKSFAFKSEAMKYGIEKNEIFEMLEIVDGVIWYRDSILVCPWNVIICKASCIIYLVAICPFLSRFIKFTRFMEIV